MSDRDDDPESLLDRAASARIEAIRARQLAETATTEQERDRLHRLAASLQERALRLEQRAFANGPPRAQIHANPQQAQQARFTPQDDDDSSKKE